MVIKNGHHAINIEDRIVKNTSLTHDQPISTIIVEKVITKTVDTIKAFIKDDQDGPLCSAFYTENLQIVETVLQKHAAFFELFRNSEKSLKQLLDDPEFVQKAVEKMIETNLHWNLHSKEYYLNDPAKLQEIYDNPHQALTIILMMLDCELIDCLLLRALRWMASAPVVPTIFVCVGAEHIKAVRPVLKKLGYTSKVIAGKENLSFFENKNQYCAPGSEPDAIVIPETF